MRLKHGFECHTGYSGSTARPHGGSSNGAIMESLAGLPIVVYIVEWVPRKCRHGNVTCVNWETNYFMTV